MSLRKVVLTLSTACRTRPRCCFPHTWALPHFPHALPSDLLSDLRCCPLHTEIYPARIYRMCLSAPWLDHTRLQVVSPRISLKRTPFFVKPMFFHRPRMTSGQRKGQSYLFSHTNEWCFPAPSAIKPEEREFVVDSGPSMHMMSWKGRNSAELVSKKSDDGCCRQRRSANKRKSDRVCQKIGFIRDNKASRRYTGRSLIRKTLRRSRIRIFLRVDQWSETTTHQKWQTDWKKQHGELRTDRCQTLQAQLHLDFQRQ